MAGKRRTNGRGLRSDERRARRQKVLVTRLAEAKTPAARVGVAADYLRAALATAAPAAAEATATTVVDLMITHADQLTGGTP